MKLQPTPVKFLYRVIDDRAGDKAGDMPLLWVSISRGVLRRDEVTDREARADDLGNYKLCAARDIVINRMRAFQGALGISPIDGLVSPDYLVLRVGPRTDSRFLTYLFRSTLFVGEMIARLRGIGSTDQGNVRTPRINEEDLGRISVGVPPLADQRAIADYLDRETARIDALVEAKKRMAALLDEHWATMVRTTALGYGWPLVSLRRLWTVTDCKHRTPTYVDEGFPVVSPGDVTPGRLNLDRCHRFVSEADFVDLTEGGRRPRRGDIVYSRNASIGIAAFVDSDEPFTMGQDVCLIRSETQHQPWLTYMLNSVGVDQLAEMKIGSTFDRVNIAQLLDLQIPAPPPDIQVTEARRLGAERQRVEALLATLQAQITIIRERRQALITAAVAGQLDIPGNA